MPDLPNTLKNLKTNYRIYVKQGYRMLEKEHNWFLAMEVAETTVSEMLGREFMEVGLGTQLDGWMLEQPTKGGSLRHTEEGKTQSTCSAFRKKARVPLTLSH